MSAMRRFQYAVPDLLLMAAKAVLFTGGTLALLGALGMLQ